MRMPSVEKWIPNLFLILMFENGRKHGLGLWLVVLGVFFFVLGMHGFGLHDMEVFLGAGSTIFVGGNVFDKTLARDAGKPDAAGS